MARVSLIPTDAVVEILAIADEEQKLLLCGLSVWLTTSAVTGTDGVVVAGVRQHDDLSFVIWGPRKH